MSTRRWTAADFRLTEEDRGLVRVWSWTRQSRRNAFHLAAWELLGQRVADLARETASPEAGPRCLVLHGEGGVFAAGADLTEMTSYDEHRANLFLDVVEGLLGGLEALPIPTVAAMDGAALGGGLELALACDLRLASEQAVCGVPAVRLGAALTPGLVARVTRAVGPSRGRDLLLTGRTAEAQEALALGLVHRLAPEGQVLDEALAWAEGLAANAPLAMRSVKAALAAVDDNGAKAFVAACLSEDFREGAGAFLERRKPRFRGR